MNTQTLQMFLYGKLAETDALLAATPYELNPDDFKIFLGRRSMLVDLMAMTLFGRRRSLALASNQCVKCGDSVALPKDDGLVHGFSPWEKEYKISALCQGCQDLFVEEPCPSGEVFAKDFG